MAVTSEVHDGPCNCTLHPYRAKCSCARNFEELTKIGIGCASVDPLGSTAPLAFLRAPPLGLGGLLGTVLAHFERKKTKRSNNFYENEKGAMCGIYF